MNRDEALTKLDDLRWLTQHIGGDEAGALYVSLRTYILNSIPTPKVEVVKALVVQDSAHLQVNGQFIIRDGFSMIAVAATSLIAALNGGGE